jgi:hypothetical protein
MHETKIEYSIEKDRCNEGKWERIYIWMTDTNYVSGSTSQLDEAKKKCEEYKKWAELNNYDCSYRIVKATITTEVLND